MLGMRVPNNSNGDYRLADTGEGSLEFMQGMSKQKGETMKKMSRRQKQNGIALLAVIVIAVTEGILVGIGAMTWAVVCVALLVIIAFAVVYRGVKEASIARREAKLSEKH